MRDNRSVWFFGISLLASGIVGCAGSTPPLVDELSSEARAVQSIEAPCSSSMRRDPVSIESARLEGGHLLQLQVRYGGGCRAHDFTLCWSGAFEASEPAGVSLSLGHDAHGDLCRAYLMEDITFDLSSLEKAYRAAYGESSSGQVSLHIQGLAERLPLSIER